MEMFVVFLKKNGQSLHKENVKVVISGRREQLSEELQAAVDHVEQLTAANTKATLNLCLNYGGRLELVDAVNKLVQRGAESVTEKDIEANLYRDLPNLDLIIRTSGEYRLSGFMLWRGEYSELLFVEKHWPEFVPEDLEMAVAEYARRERPFGK